LEENAMTETEFKDRTKQFALRILKLVDALPRRRSADVLAKQLARSGTSVGANYRAACRARSAAEFVAKLGIAEEEADESAWWIELVTEHGLLPADRLTGLHDEAVALTKMIAASRITARGNRKSAIENRKS
jgi:four helix bundle protein